MTQRKTEPNPPFSEPQLIYCRGTSCSSTPVPAFVDIRRFSRASVETPFEAYVICPRLQLFNRESTVFWCYEGDTPGMLMDKEELIRTSSPCSFFRPAPGSSHDKNFEKELLDQKGYYLRYGSLPLR